MDTCARSTAALPRRRSPHLVFGVVTRGMNVLDKIAAGGEDDQNGPGDGYPNRYVRILSVVIGR